MEHEKIIVGLDIGTTKVCVLVGRLDQDNGLSILGVGQAPAEGIMSCKITNLDKATHAITRAIQQAEGTSGIDIRIANVGIAERHVKSTIHRGSITREATDEEITVADVRKLTHDMYRTVVPPGHEIIHVIPQSYCVDYEPGIRDPVGMTGVKLEADFHIITAQTRTINHIYKCVRRAGLEVDHLILEPLAASLSILSEEEKEVGVCLVDIGSGSVNVGIFHDALLCHTAILPIAGDSITSDIKAGCQVMNYQAALLKDKFGKAIVEQAHPHEVVTIPTLRNRPPKEIGIANLARIIEARMAEIIELIHTEIILSGFQDKLAAGVVITGGGAKLHHIKQLFEYVTGLDTRVGCPSEYPTPSAVDDLQDPSYATLTGLMLAGLPPTPEQVAHQHVVTAMDAATLAKRDSKAAKKGGQFLKKILDKTKGLLIDDYEV
ncbi:MAG: cell division protein FtsA [Bacteroidota bacterium]